jgi:hypothetical protein
MKTVLRLGPVLLILAVAGCGRSSEPSTPDTGSREAVRGFYDALIRRDWPGAYALLHPDAAKGLSAQEFSRRAEAYRGKLGFDPTRVAVRTCEEHGDEATARISLSGPGGSRHAYGDNLFLRRHDGQWRVILPARFGQR